MSLLTKWAFGNKVAVTLMTILILIVGAISYFTLPMEFLPEADNPQVTVVVIGQGTDSKTMETEVTTPIENAVSGVTGKKNILSTTGDGFSKIDLFFESKTDMKQAKQDVQEAINNLNLPSNVLKPSVVQLNTTMIPIAELAVSFKDGVTNKNVEFMKEKIVPLYKDINGVSSVNSMGASFSYVSIKVDNQLLSKYQIPLQNVMNSIKGQNESFALGEKVIGKESSNINVFGELDSLEKVKNVSVAPNIKLEKIADVEIMKPQDTVARFNGEDSFVIDISKESNSNVVSVNKEINKVTKSINKKYDQVEAKVLLSTADMVQSSVHSMMKEVLLGALFATIVIMLFLRNIRSTFITIVSIPLSLCFTLFLLDRSGVTLNILTLGGVAVAVGRLVDDSIVVIENIFRKMQTEKFSIQMIMDATKEVGKAITASTLTTVAVFLPIGLVGGGLQDFMLPFALTITYSLLTSLVVALTVVPLMSAGLLKKTKLPEHKPAHRFTKVVTWSLNHKWVVLTLSIVLFASSIATYFMMPKGATDSSNADFVQATISYPNNTPVEKVKEKAIQLEKSVMEIDEAKYVFTQMGNSAESAQYGNVSSPTMATVGAILKDKKDTDKIVKEIQKYKDDYDGAIFDVAATSIMSGSSKTSITIDVVGNNLKDLEATSNDIKEKISGIDGIEKVSSNQEEKKTVYSFHVDTEKGNTEQIAGQLGMMLNKTPIGTVQLEDQQTAVYLEPVISPESEKDLKDIPIMTEQGMIPVSKVASLEKENKPTSQFHKDGDTYLRLIAEVDPKKLSEVDKDIKLEIFGDKKENKGMELPKDVKIFVGGASADTAEDFTDLFITMLVSIGLVFLIMVITFKTIKAPIAILCSLPLAAIGAIFGLFISGIAVEITALLGALMLIGIVVTNAIVLLDRVKQNEKKNMILRDAIVEACATRMRPIFMTAVATICAMFPLLFKKAESTALVSQSLAIVVIGGLAVATLLTLIVIPVVYELLNFKKSKKQRLEKQKLEQQQQAV